MQPGTWGSPWEECACVCMYVHVVAGVREVGGAQPSPSYSAEGRGQRAEGKGSARRQGGQQDGCGCL